jgi:hypothetical protein
LDLIIKLLKKMSKNNISFFPSHIYDIREKPTNDIGAGVPFSDSAISKAMRSSETNSQIATRKGQGLYVASSQPPTQVTERKRDEVTSII